MPLPTKFIALCSVAFTLIVGCQNDAPKQNATQESTTPAPDYATGGPDTSITKSAIDPHAKEGLNEIHYKSGMLKAKGNYESGRKVGEWQSFYENGKLWSDEFFTNGVRDGKVTVWYSNGQKMYEGEYKNGKPTGTWTYWTDKGQVQRTADYNKKAANTAM